MNKQIAEGHGRVEHEDWTLPILPPSDLPYDDGVPLESDWHRAAMTLLIESLRYNWRDRADFFAGGNMFVYFSLEQVRNRDFRGPDFFVARGVERNKPRLYWATWDEGGKAPNVIVELTSLTTAKEDRTTKKDIYEQTLRTSEYYLYDPAKERLEGWRLGDDQRYAPIGADERGWLWSKQLDLWLGKWTGNYQEVAGVYPRFYDQEGNLILISGEDQGQRVEAERQQKEIERQRADAEKQQKEIERQRADAEKQQKEIERQRADAEKLRADAAEAELVRLKARLGKPEGKQPPP